jgi:transposase
MKAYSLDLRQKVLAAVLRGDRTIHEIAESFDVGATFVDKVLALHRAGEGLAPRAPAATRRGSCLGTRSCCAPRCGGART